MGPVSPFDPARWAVVSPWLNRLLDAGLAGRAGVLAEAAAQDAALPGELRAWLTSLDGQDTQTFMHAPARDAGVLAAADGMAPSPGPAGQRVGAYVVQSLLGQGGMGSVWLAQRADGRYQGQVAIKFLHGGLFGRGDAKRFAREGQILARLDHPHIARLLDAGLTDTDAQPYLVLEFVQGLSIDAHVRDQGLDTRATVALFMDVLAAVAHAHERLILHRDLKPSNILVTPQGQVKLLDFGIAKLVSDALDTAPSADVTQLTQQAGRAYTLRYAAPEQVQGGEATAATDVYALGVLLHVLLTGGLHPTASADSDAPLEQLQALVHTAPRRPSDAVARQGGPQARRLARTLQGDLDTIIGRALKKQPAARYRNAAELADDLRRHLNHEPITARADSQAYRLARFARRNRWGVAAATSVVLALGVGTALALQSAREARQQSAQAESLVEFMLEDLRPKLESVNRLDVMDAVGAKVLAYYEQQDVAHADASALRRRGQALTLVGRMAQKRGQLADAEQTLSQAVQSLAELTRREPDNAQALFSHGAGLNALAVVQRLRGNLASAEAGNRQSLALHRQAYALQPDTVALRKLVEAQSNFANFYNNVGRPADALPLFEEAHTGAQRLAQTTPAAWATVANMRHGLANLQYQAGRIAESIATSQTALQALAQVPGAADSAQVLERRAGSLTRLASSQLAIGQVAQAADNFSAAVSAAAALSEREPNNPEWVVLLLRCRLFLAETLSWAGRTAQAQTELQQAQANLQNLLQRPEPTLEWRLRLRGGVLVQRALLTPESAGLAAELQAFLDAFSGPQAQGITLTSVQRRVVAEVGLQLGNMLALKRQTAQAQAAWRTALASLRLSSQAGLAPAMAMAAQLHWRLGDTDQAEALAAEIDKGEFRHPDYVAFRQEMQRAAAAAPAPAPAPVPKTYQR